MKKIYFALFLISISASLFADAEDIFRTFGVRFGDKISDYKTLPDDYNVPAIRVQQKTKSDIFPDDSMLYLYDDGTGHVEGFIVFIDKFPDIVIKYPSGDIFLNNPKNEEIEFLFRKMKKATYHENMNVNFFFDEDKNFYSYQRDYDGNYIIDAFLYCKAPIYDDVEIVE